MTWYWIVLIIIGYFIIGSIFAGLSSRFDRDLEAYEFANVILWPFFLPFYLLVSMCDRIINLCKGKDCPMRKHN